MSGIGGIGSYSSFFSQLDTRNKGYIDKSDLASAFAKIAEDGASDDSASIDQGFGQLDSDGDGKITQDEMSNSLQKLASELESQFNRMRMDGGMGGMGGTPPPPPQDDAGFSKDELQSQLDEIGGTDGKRSELLANIVSNFDEADADGDGKVSFKEAMAYDRQSRSDAASDGAAGSGGSADAASTTATNAGAGSELAVMKRIMALVQAYAAGETETKSGRQSGSFSIAA